MCLAWGDKKRQNANRGPEIAQASWPGKTARPCDTIPCKGIAMSDTSIAMPRAVLKAFLEHILHDLRPDFYADLWETVNTSQPADTATQPPRRSRERERARVHRHTVKRQIEASVTLPHIQKHGFTHPSNGHFLMLPPEYDVIQALEKKAVVSVVLAVLRRTMGAPGDGPYGRKEWVQLSTHALADATLMAHGAARRGITEAVKKGYLLRRRAGGVLRICHPVARD